MSKAGKKKRDSRCVLVLQGGGALGAYQAGAYEALAEHGYAPDWVAGISIGAINGAIIAGNLPQNRVGRLRQFWERVTSGMQGIPLSSHFMLRSVFNETSALLALASGAPGFFVPRPAPPIFVPATSPTELGYYSTAPLQETLQEFVDFDLISEGQTRLSIGAVNVRTGNFAYFDSGERRITPAHVMASGALPPGLPPVEIDNEFYWDGGVVSNAPLQHVLDQPADCDVMSIFQVDLFSAEGTLPGTLFDAVEREKEIRYSSRTRLNTDMMRDKVKMRRALKRLLRKLPAELHEDPDAKFLAALQDDPDVSIMHLIYRARAYESHARDYEFSRVSMEEHWQRGRADVIASLSKDAWTRRSHVPNGLRTYDLAHGEKVK